MQQSSRTPKKQRERAKFWRDPELEGVEILHANYFTHSFTRHTHDAYAISVIDCGVGAFWYRGSVHPSPAGYLGLLNPGEPHTGHVVGDAGWTYRALYVEPKLLSQVASDIADRPLSGCWFPEPIVQDEQVAQSMRVLHRTLVEPSSTVERESRLLAVFIQLLMRHAENPPAVRRVAQEHHAVKRVREYIEAHYAEDVSLQQLALIAQLNPFHLVAVFRNALGLPPHAYLNQVRVSRARALIRSGEPIAQVAYATGFVDQSHLTRRFKQVLGVTPGQLVRS